MSLAGGSMRTFHIPVLLDDDALRRSSLPYQRQEWGNSTKKLVVTETRIADDVDTL